jgi:hypothetical protein
MAEAGVVMFPFIPHGIYIFKMIRPGIVFPCAISAAEGIAESFVTAGKL